MPRRRPTTPLAWSRSGIDAVVVAGSTGEAATLDDEERSDLLIAVRSAVDGRVPVLAGTGATSARQAVVL